jgi:amino-acid N-acetyltransferase
MADEKTQFVEWFRSTSPYIRVHKGKTFVIHIEDHFINSTRFNEFVHDLALLNSLEIRLVLAYSTRFSIENRMQGNDSKMKYHEGIRVTDHATLDIVKEAAGKLRIDIESALSMGLGNTPMSNAEVIVSSGNYVRAKPMGVVDGVDYQFTGMVRSVETENINAKLDANEIVLIPPLGYSITGETFNLEAKSMAQRLAVELHADKLIYLTDFSGLTDESGHMVRQLTALEAETLLKSSEKIDEKIYKYLLHGVDACMGGVERVHLLDSSIEAALVQELFSRDGIGTMISRISYDELRQATISDITGILELISPLEKQGVLVERSREKLELEIENFVVMLRDDVIIGCASLYVFPEEKAAEVACLVIHEDYHKFGRGAQLYEMLEQTARRAGVKRIFVMTTHAAHWFLELGFKEGDTSELPVAKQDLYNYQRNSKILYKDI